ncbi:MAG TPA: hypothetical protein PKA98_06000, partial [Acidimicrobiales bacterium]|nr:hypothetical protein [Acidimicrobiales bacterium]
FRNLGEVHTISAGELNAYDVLVSDWVIFTEATLPSAEAPVPAADERATTEAGTEADTEEQES